MSQVGSPMPSGLGLLRNHRASGAPHGSANRFIEASALSDGHRNATHYSDASLPPLNGVGLCLHLALNTGAVNFHSANGAVRDVIMHGHIPSIAMG